jgi:hypothetical protein
VGRASNRKKARRQEALRQAQRRTRRVTQGSRADPGPQQAALALAAAQEETERVVGAPREHMPPEYRVWCEGQPVPAEVPSWAKGSLGERLCSGMHLSQARNAPCLLTATVPNPIVIITDPAQWSAAANVLVRAVVFDGLRVDHPAVSRLLDTLAPVVEAELVHEQNLEDWYSSRWGEDEEEPVFPELDGPVFLIGTCALGDATLAVVGEDPLDDVLAALSPILDGTVPGLEGRAVADVLTGGRVIPYLCQLPDHVLKRMQRAFVAGCALSELLDGQVVPPRDILRIGLTLLSALAELCKSDSASILRRAA